MTKIDFFNDALLKIGSQLEITGDGDESQEYRICERVYERALKEVYSLYPWHCCRKIATLNRYVNCDHNRFSKKFSLPPDLLVMVKVYPEREEFQISGEEIYSNAESLDIEYTAYITNLSDLKSHVYNCCVSRLATLILPGLAKGSYNIKDSIVNEFYQIDIINAKRIEVAENFTRPKKEWWIE